MESTGVYWFLIYNVLEAGAAEDFKFNITVANLYHMKNVPGKKTDIKDSRWIAGLLRAGLLEPSYSLQGRSVSYVIGHDCNHYDL